MVRLGSWLDRWSLQYRITAGVGFGLAVILALFGYVAFWSIGQATDEAVRERQHLTMLLAHDVETALSDVDADAPPAAVAVAVQPLLDYPQTATGGGLQAEIIDAGGTVIAAAEPRPAYALGPTRTEHAALLADLIAGRRAGVRTHTPRVGPVHVVAYAPLALPDRRQWGITVEQRQDALLDLPRRMRQRMLLIGAVALAAASALAWLDVRRVVGPLRRVTLAAQRIAAGDLSIPLAGEQPHRGDEVGRLTIALDTMRRRLLGSLDEIREWNQQLEQRVRQRTQELAAAGELRRRLLRKVIEAQEEERKRLARELHDDTVQTLSGLAMTLQAVEDVLPPQQARQREQLAWAKEQAVHAAREIRQRILGLRPSALDDLGLVAAVRWYATTQLEPAGVEVEFDVPEEPLTLPPLVQTAAFRVLQEALANVAKHAGAHRVLITVTTEADELWAAVEDDGQGFDAAAAAQTEVPAGDVSAGIDPGRGLGLLGMRERIALLGGRLTLESTPGAGTTVAFTLPLRDAPPLAEEAALHDEGAPAAMADLPPLGDLHRGDRHREAPRSEASAAKVHA